MMKKVQDKWNDKEHNFFSPNCFIFMANDTVCLEAEEERSKWNKNSGIIKSMPCAIYHKLVI